MNKIIEGIDGLKNLIEPVLLLLYKKVFHPKTISCIIIMALSHDELVEKREDSSFKNSLKLFLKKVLKKVKRDDILILVAKTSDAENE